MFAGLPGIGVGTLFYVLMAFWMPLRELPRVVRGTSSLAQWQLISRQLFYATGIVVTVMFAERVLLWLMGAAPQPFSPAALLYHELGSRTAETSLLAAPITASLLLLGGVILAVELLRVIVRPQPRPAPEFVDGLPLVHAERRGASLEQPLEIG
jgi:hypothetical protein